MTLKIYPKNAIFHSINHQNQDLTLKPINISYEEKERDTEEIYAKKQGILILEKHTDSDSIELF